MRARRRFFSAAREVASDEARRILGLALDRSCARMPDLPGMTVALADNSGSAVGCAVSSRGSLRIADAGNMLEAVLARRLGSRAMIGVFGDLWTRNPMTLPSAAPSTFGPEL